MGIEQGNSRALEVALPANITADDYVGTTVSITGDWGTTTQVVTRSSKAEQWLNFEIQPAIFEATTGKKKSNPIVHFYINPDQAKADLVAIVAITITTKDTIVANVTTTIRSGLIAPLDIYKANNKPYGIILRLKTKGKPGIIMSLDQAKDKWSTDIGYIENANSRTDGAANTAAVGSYPAKKHPIFSWCAAKNLAAPTGIKWYIPAIDELTIIYEQKAALNAVLEKIDNANRLGNIYLSSTQHDHAYILGLETDSGYEFKNTKVDSLSFARALSVY